MKKIFTLMLALFAMVAIQAQNLLSEDFENGIPTTWLNIDADNDSYAWMEGVAPGVSGHNGSNGCAYSCSYYDGTVLTPNNWLITPAVTLTGNATLTFWVAAQDASYAAEHYGVYISTTAGTTPADFTLLYEETLDANGGARVQGTWKQKTVDLSSYTGQTVRIAFRHFNCTDMFYIDLDDVVIFAQPTSPTIVAVPTDIDFGATSIGNSLDATVDITTYNLTAGVTATTTAPFAVSADGTSFGTTATVAAAGGSLYVRYAPTAVGTDNGTVTLASTGATSQTITLTGTGIDCSNITIPFTEDFESSIGCWTMISMDPANDDKFGLYADANAYAGSQDFRFSSFNTATDYNQWLISPELTLPAGQTYMVNFFFKAYSASDYFKVMYSTTNNNPSSFTMLADYTTVYNTWTETSLELPAGTKYVAIDYYGNYAFYLYVDNFSITALTAPDVTIAGPTELELGAAGTFTATSSLADTYAWMVDGTAVPGTTETLTHTFTTAGIHNVKVIASNNIGSGVDSMDVEVYVCEAITQYPYAEGFENGLRCWGMVSMDPTNDGNFGILNNADYAYEGDNCFLFSSYTSASDYNQYLITPELQIPTGASYMFNFYYMGYSDQDNFKVMYSTTTNDISAFTVLADYTDVAEEWTEAAVTLPAGTKYVAINYYGDYAYYLFVDNISISQLTAPTVTITGTTTVEVGTPAEFTAVSPLAETFAWTVDGNAVAGTTNTLTHTFTTTGNHTIGVTVTNSVGSASATHTVNVYTCDGVQALPYFEGFESGFGCWIDNDYDGDGYSWASTLGTGIEAYEGEGAMLSNSYVNNVGAVEPDNWLISPAIAIPSQGATLTWYVAAQDPSWAAETYDVMISTGTSISSYTSLFNETLASGDWEQRSVNINGNWAGQTVHIAFRHHDVTDMFAMKIDNVNITAGTGIENYESNVTIYPNPVKDVLNINATSNINRVEVYNMMGQMVGSFNANDVNTQINTSSFANGVYTVKISTENGMTTKKFTVAR